MHKSAGLQDTARLAYLMNLITNRDTEILARALLGHYLCRNRKEVTLYY